MAQKKRVLNYPDYELECDLCGERFRTPQGLLGHRRLRHSAVMNETASPGFPGAQPITALRQQVDQLKLQVQKHKLESELPPAGNKSLDIMEQSGLGSFDNEVRAGIQRRALGMDQKPMGTWLDKLLANPEALKIAVDALKGVIGTNRNDGDNLATLLKDLGFSVKDLITQASSPRAGSDLEIAGINLKGATLSPDLLIALLKYRESEEAIKAKVEAQKEQNSMIAELVKKFGPLLNEIIDRRSGRLGGISQESSAEVQNVIRCPVCGKENLVPADIKPGDVVRCSGENCPESWVAEDTRAEQRPRAKTVKREVEVKPEPTILNCPNCNQAVDITDKPLGSMIACPMCQNEFKLTSDSIAVPAAEPLSESQKDKAANDFRGGWKRAGTSNSLKLEG
jgi:transcription elongation factor Elf1